ncbi:MAG: hypothetical protein ACJAVV_000143 [Alphaproteobacteria bacterium]|jgi:hypothetical protein
MSNTKKPSIEELIVALEKYKNPERDLWQGIEFGLQQNTNTTADIQGEADKSPTQVRQVRSSLRPVYALAASVTLALLVGYFSFQTGRVESGQALIVQMSEQHSLQKDSLLTSLQGQPTTTQNWQQQIAELDEAAVAIKKALENEPNNAALLKMLQRVYEQQIALIERVHAPAWQQI